MSATDELRRLLDERGVEHFESPNGIAWGERLSPTYGFRHRHYAVELDGLLCVSSHRITPEQAIAATLGNDGVERSSDGVAERERDQLKDENAHLREMSKFNYESSEFYRDRAHRLLVERDNLKAENAKLRELVRCMWQSDYARNFSTLKEDVELRAMVYQRIKQLGVEVDE